MPAATTSRTRKRAAKPASLYKRLGGAAALRKAVDLFHERALADSGLAAYFERIAAEGIDIERLKDQQRALLAEALGGPKKRRRSGPEAARVHAETTPEDFSRALEHLVGALAEAGAPRDAIDEAASALGSLAGRIVCAPPNSGRRRSLEALASNLQGKNNTAMSRTHINGGAASVAEPPRLDDSAAGLRAQIEALSRSQAVVEFDLDGTILTANDNFLRVVGYSLDEIRGRHHRILCEPAYAERPEYAQFWRSLADGKFEAGDYKRVTKDGRAVWLRASYNPLLDERGKAFKVVKYASEITAIKLRELEAERVQSMMENLPINTIYADLDLRIQYMNPASIETLRKLQQYLPVRADEMLGQSIDIFHKNPAHQRRLLADPSNLPRRANIQIGPETLELLVSAIRGKDGEYLGAMMTWEVITERLEAENRAQELVERERRQAEQLHSKVDAMLEVVNKVKEGDLTQLVETSGDDAMAQMGEGLSSLLRDLRGAMTQIAENAQQVASSAEELTAVSQQMAGNAEETATQAGVVSAASEEVTRNVQTVATGAEEMSASIREIAKSSSEAARIAKQAVKVADSANSTIKELGESSVEIGKVIKVITSIAQQTNLLALNATIEAARAGEAGKGFAVVANEVKELAKQTALATEDISQKIEAIQSGSTGAVEAIAEVGAIINQINDISNTIASSVEEQTATTNEITRNVTEAARGSAEISENVTGVATAAGSTTQGATDTLQAAMGLAEMASQLQRLVARFKV